MPGPEDAMRPANPGVKLTYDDFVLFPDDGRRHELIDGEHYVTPSPNRKHQSIVGNLHFLIRSYLEGRDAGRVFVAPFDVLFSSFDVVEPDLLYISRARLAAVTGSDPHRGSRLSAVSASAFDFSMRSASSRMPPTLMHRNSQSSKIFTSGSWSAGSSRVVSVSPLSSNNSAARANPAASCR
jgi:hypothetical protein